MLFITVSKKVAWLAYIANTFFYQKKNQVEENILQIYCKKILKEINISNNKLKKLTTNWNKHKSSLHKKWSFPLRISSINVIKSAVYFGFGEEIFNRNLHFLCSA